MNITCRIPPLREPITVGELKEYLRLEDDGENALLESIIKTARETVESYTGRALITRTYHLVTEGFGLGAIELPHPPFVALDKVMRLSGRGQEITVPVRSINRHTPVCSIILGISLVGESPVEITYRAGYGDMPDHVPGPLRQGVLMVSAQLYEGRGSSMGKLDEGVLALIRPYQLRRLQ